MSENPDIVFEFFRSLLPWDDADSVLAADGFNSANLAFSLLAWRGIDYFAILSVGEDEDEPFDAGDRIKMAEVSTDWGMDVLGTGENIRMNQTFANRSRVNWNYEIAA
jgi:hypothetical protein